MRSLVLFVVLFSTCYGNSQIEEVRRITKQLCSQEFHGRGYVNKGDSIAASFLVEEFQKVGAIPFESEFLQSFELNVNTFPGKMQLIQGVKSLIPGIDFSINPSSKGGSYVLNPTEVSPEQILDLDYIRSLLSKIGRTPSTQIIVFDVAGASQDTLKLIQPIIREIATIMPVAELVNKKFTWSVGRDQSFFPFFQIQDSVYTKGVQLTMDVEATLIEGYKTQNVIAYLPSKKKCAKTLMFTAHYDHLGRMGSKTYFPGANDNASGSAMLLTMASYFKEHPSKYNVMFVAFAGEEAGLVGSKYFTEHPILKLKKIKFLVNLDIMGSGEDGVTVVNGTLFKNEFELLQQINEEEKLLSNIKIRGPAANSDHFWFTQKGVPAFFIYTMGPNNHITIFLTPTKSLALASMKILQLC